MEYPDEAYVAAHRRFRNLGASMRRALGGCGLAPKIETEWPRLSVESSSDGVSEIRLGEEVLVSTKVTLNSLSPDEVSVQVLAGLVDADGNLKEPVVVPMHLSERDGAGSYLFQTVVRPTARSGLHGYAIRVLPKHADSSSLFLPGLIKWAQASTPVAELQAR